MSSGPVLKIIQLISLINERHRERHTIRVYMDTGTKSTENLHKS